LARSKCCKRLGRWHTNWSFQSQVRSTTSSMCPKWRNTELIIHQCSKICLICQPWVLWTSSLRRYSSDAWSRKGMQLSPRYWWSGASYQRTRQLGKNVAVEIAVIYLYTIHKAVSSTPYV
jgi:hypothetical protein